MLDAGSVIYLTVSFSGGPRNKYLVVLDVDTEVYVLAINTSINLFYGRGPFRDCYVPIDRATHKFLTHDSYIDCNQVIPLRLPDVVAELRENANCVKGVISSDVQHAVIAAIKATPCLSPDDKHRYIKCLS